MRVSDRQIREVIDALRARDGRASGAAVRAELARRHGARGGVERVYRLLGESRGAYRDAERSRLVSRLAALEKDLADARSRAELAEHRERVHQASAAAQIDALRTRLHELERSPRIQGVPHEDYLQLHRTLADARLRLAALEAERTEMLSRPEGFGGRPISRRVIPPSATPTPLTGSGVRAHSSRDRDFSEG